MAYIYRIALFFFCLSASVSVLAGFPPSHFYSASIPPHFSNNHPDAASACSAVQAQLEVSLAGGYGAGTRMERFGNLSNNECNFRAGNATTWFFNAFGSVEKGLPFCPTGSLVNGLCECLTTSVEVAGQCVSPEAALCTSLKGSIQFVVVPGVSNPGSSLCTSIGCRGNFSSMVMGIKNKITGILESSGDFTFDGSTCVVPLDAAKSGCSGSYGQVNGVDTCVPYTADDVNSADKKIPGPSVTSSSPAGAASSSLPGAPAGATGSSQTTNCVGGSCTTKTTYTNGDGGVVGTTETIAPQANFCKDNPELSICKTGKFDGSCGSPPKCEGDAVQCATAVAVFRSNCVLNPTPNEISDLFEDSKNKTGNVTGDLPGNETIAISSSSFSTVNNIGGSGGMSDRVIVVAGKTITIPFSRVNQYLTVLGNVLLACCFILAARILLRG